MTSTPERLDQLESLLGQCIIDEKTRWIQIYRLMVIVKERKLYEDRDGIKSFSAWVRAFAAEHHIHESALWRRYKAGCVYDEYASRAAARARKRLREELALAKEKPRPKEAVEDTVVADDIIRSVSRGGWVDEVKCGRFCRKKIYQVFTEFPADSGSCRTARRMDALIAENLSTPVGSEVVLRGIEIKVTRSDLIGDEKMSEYADFVDYFYIAIPNDPAMIEAADLVRLPAWGVIALNADGTLSVLRKPERLPAVFRDKTLSNIIIRLV